MLIYIIKIVHNISQLIHERFFLLHETYLKYVLCFLKLTLRYNQVVVNMSKINTFKNNFIFQIMMGTLKLKMYAVFSFAVCLGVVSVCSLPASAGTTSPNAFLQNNNETKQQASGTVKDVDGEPIIGATVMEKGTKNATVTDFDGNFHLNVSPNAVLQISYIGYNTQFVKVAGNKPLDVVMSETEDMLNEVVVTGYTTQRKADLTGAVSVMSLDKPISESNPNMLNSMQGRLAGVQIVTDASPGGGDTSIRIRGMSTVNSNSPLYVIDGVATTENLNSLNSADIESIQVLKDAASASIYGSRAANGVVIITTKRGKGDKLNVNVNYSASLQTVAKTYKMLNTQQWGEVYWDACKNAGVTASHPLYGSGDTPQVVSYATDTDWQKEVYSPAWTQNLSASVSNSSEKGSVLFSGNYINQNGLMDYTFYRRFSARLNSTYKISKYVNVGENLMVANWQNRGYTCNDDRGVPYSAMRQHPGIGVYNEDGSFVNPVDALSSDIDNPVQTLYNGRDDTNESWRIFGNGYIEIIPVKGLTLKSNIGIEHLQFFNRTLTRKVNDSDVASVSREYGQGDTWTWTNTANYNVDFGKKHHLNVLAGVEAIKYKYENLSAFRNGYAFEDENYMQIDAGEDTQTNGGGKSEWALFSLFAKADYNFADRYLFSAIIRRDQTSRLYKNQNSGVFPSFSGAWRFTEEKFFPKNKIINNGKLRLGWGQNGNSAIDNLYASYSTYAYNTGNAAYDINGTNNNVVAGIVTAASGNKNLKWETTTQTNLGLDLGFLNNDLRISFDYYWKNTKNMLTVPPTLSVQGENASVYMNTGNMKNTGFEVTVDYTSPEYSGFSWEGSFNIGHYKNKVEKLNSLVSQIGSDILLMEGQPMGVYYGYVADGIFQNEDEVNNHAIQQGKGVGRIRYRDLDGNGVIDENDRCVIGDPNPDLSLGLNLDFHYKNFTLSMFFTGEFGFDIYNSTKKQLDFMSYGGVSTNRGASILNAWSPTNTNSSIPAVSVSDDNDEMRMSTYFIEDGSYFKMKYIKLAYELPRKICKSFCSTNVSFFAQVENVFTITGYSGLDPELPLGTYGARVDNGPYPAARTFSLGLSIGF